MHLLADSSLHFYLTNGNKFGSHLSRLYLWARISRLSGANKSRAGSEPAIYTDVAGGDLRCSVEARKLAHGDYDAFCDGYAGTPIGIHWRQFISADAGRGWNLSVPLLPRPLNCTPVLIKRRRARREYPTARFCPLFCSLSSIYNDVFKFIPTTNAVRFSSRSHQVSMVVADEEY